MRAVYMSLRPEFADQMEVREKDHEFRDKLPSKPFDEWFVYVTVPEASLKYVCRVGTPVDRYMKLPVEDYGNLINPNLIDNALFNTSMLVRFAIPILSMSKLKEPIPLRRLQKEFGFYPPQFFAYDERYPELTRHILKAAKRVIF
jgi:predicted transcriptional regulator